MFPFNFLTTVTHCVTQAIDETTVLNRKSNETQSSDGTVPDDGNDIGTKKRCVTLDARIQSIQIQVSDSNGGKIEFGGVECAKVNLVNAELLNRANAETIKLKSTNAKLTQELKTLKMMMVTQHEEIKGLKAQVTLPFCVHRLIRNGTLSMIHPFSVKYTRWILKRSVSHDRKRPP